MIKKCMNCDNSKIPTKSGLFCVDQITDCNEYED